MLAWLFGTRPSPSPPVAPAAPRPTAGPSLGLRDGDVLGDRYRLDREIGIGGVGRVYQATDLHLEMVVAVKAMRRRIVRDEDTPSLESVVDLRREAAAAMRLSHPFITRVFTWERYRGWDVIIMEYIEGTTLQGRMGAEPDRRLAPEVGAGFALDALSALAYAHARGVCHNDVKPRNFLVTEGDQLKLCDFGIASPVGAESSTSGSGLIGTLAFISPERLRTATEWVLALGDPATWAVPCDPSRCHCPLAGARDTAPVRAHPGSATADGLHDMLGNVWEWTESADGLGAIAADRAKVFGASFRHACRASRGEVPQSEVSAQSAYPYLGFRCARDEEVP